MIEGKLKLCSKCKEYQVLTEFYKDKHRKDNLNSYCKSCMVVSCAKYRKTPQGRLAVERGRIKYRKGVGKKAWYKKHPLANKVHIKVCRALKLNKIKKPNVCTDCGCLSKSIHAHHKDYNKPFGIDWLCPSCHKKLHYKVG